MGESAVAFLYSLQGYHIWGVTPPSDSKYFLHQHPLLLFLYFRSSTLAPIRPLSAWSIGEKR
jgi:hypothetical protein